MANNSELPKYYIGLKALYFCTKLNEGVGHVDSASAIIERHGHEGYASLAILHTHKIRTVVH